MRSILSRLRAALALGCVLFVGCSRGPHIYDVDGLATSKDKPVPYVLLNFIPENGRPSWGITDEQGNFKLTYTEQQPGAVEGKHKVTVAFRPRSPKEEYEIQTGARRLHPDHKAILAKYGDPATTTLEVDIKEPSQKVHLRLD